MARLNEDQLERYSRQLLLPGFGGAAQKALQSARVAMVGAGGLGSPVIEYLAAAGVGELHIIDSDSVELSNLQRQVIHARSPLGTPKAESAATAACAINPDCRAVPHVTRLTVENAEALLGGVDLVLDGSDNFPTRFLVNDACYLLGKPLISGAILRFEGQLTVFPNDHGADSPCYRCLFPEIPPPGAIPTCQEAGILGPVAGMIGTMQAVEALKILTGIGEPLVGRLLVVDALTMAFRSIRLHRDAECALNGDRPTMHGLGVYTEQGCRAADRACEPQRD
ncbi:molybdopterin-synthase adenylyltransferase MoeB [bacterium]|nr:molybdopterin-synthase adenylyltransferase MoeB [bacterium]